MIYFYKYDVEWFDDTNNFKGEKESGITIGENYTEASSNVAQLYGDDQLGYIHLVCISNDSSTPVMTAEELKDYGIEVKNNE
jgi:phage FluMu gp28-like protein